MQRILEQHVGGGEFIDDLGIPGISPEPLEPTADNSLVVLFARHGIDPPLWLKASPPSDRVVSTSEVGGSYIRILRSDSGFRRPSVRHPNSRQPPAHPLLVGSGPQVLIEPIQCALPSFLGGSLVVTGRRVVVEAVIGVLVDMSLMWHLRLGQRGVEGRPSVGNARVLLSVLRIDRRLDLGRIGGASMC